jgi:hypothetical protein
MLDVLEIRLYMIISFLCNHREEKVHVRTKFAFVRIFFCRGATCWKYDAYNLTKTRSLSSYFSCLVLIYIVFKLALVSSRNINKYLFQE